MTAIRIVLLCSLLFIVAGCGSSDDMVSAPTTQKDLWAPDLSSTASSPIVYWNFDEGVGNVLNDVTGNGNDGTVFGATWVTGYSGNALQFDGQNDYVATSFAPIIDQNDSFILEFAFKDLSPVSTQEYVFGLERTNGQENSFMISGSSRIGQFRFRDDSHNVTDIQTPTALNVDQWYLIRIERRVSTDQILLYIDNVLVATTEDLTQTNVNAVATRTLELGSDNNSTFPHRGPFSGVIDEMRFTFDTGSFSLDIKPGSCPNPINPKSKGKLPVAILGTADSDVLDIDVSSLLLEGVAPIRSSIEDVTTPFVGEECDCTEEDPDGYDDLTLKFETQEIVAAIGPVSPGDEKVLTITGNLLDGTPFEASDCVVVVGGKKDRGDEWIVFARDNDVWRVRPNGSDIERVVDLPAGVQVRGITLSPDASRLAYLEYYSEFSTSNRLVLVDIDGSNPQTLVPTGGNGASGVCDFHPDGTHVMYYRDVSPGGGQNYELYEVALDGTSDVNLTNNTNNDGGGSYSPTGDQIAFHSGRAFCSACVSIYTQNHDGTGRTEIFDRCGNSDNTAVCSPDGARILVSSRCPAEEEDLYLIDPDGSNPVQLTNTFGVRERHKAWSPDGNRIVFERSGDLYFIDRDGSDEVLFLDNAAWPDWAGGVVIGGKEKPPFARKNL